MSARNGELPLGVRLSFFTPNSDYHGGPGEVRHTAYVPTFFFLRHLMCGHLKSTCVRPQLN